MKKIILILFTITLLTSCSDKEVHYQSLVERNGLMYEVNKSKPFSGKVFQKFNNEQYKMSGYYEKGLKTGEWVYNYSNGQIQKKENYKKNSLNGSLETYMENGNPLLKTGYLNGKYDGNYKEHNNRNTLLKDINYKNGQYNGSYKEYNKNGTLITETNYKNGSIDGDYINNYENGNIHFSYTMSNNNYVGDHFEYNTDKTIKKHLYYKNGNKKNKGTWKKYWNSDWKIMNSPSMYYSLVDFNNDGKPSSKLKFFIQKNGKKQSEHTYLSIEPDLKEGESIWYSENGKITMKGNYKNGKRDGLWETYYKSDNYVGNRIRERANYNNGELKGSYSYFGGGEKFENSSTILGIRFQTISGHWKVTANIQSEISQVVFKVWVIFKDSQWSDGPRCRYKMDYYVKHINKRYSDVNSYLQQNSGLYYDVNNNLHRRLRLKDNKKSQNKLSCE